MRLFFLAIFLCLIFCLETLAYTSTYNLSEDHRAAYNKITELRFDEAEEILSRIKKEQPENLLVYHVENYIDFISIFINEDEEEFRLKERNKDRRLALLRQGDPSDPYYLFSQAEIHLHWALTRIKFEEYIKAGREVNKAIGLLKRNQKRFPDFISNKKSLSILHAVAGTIPDKYKGVIGLISNFEGTIDQGLREINDVLAYASENEYFFEKEAVAIKAMILLHLKNEQEAAWKLLNDSSIDPVNNPLGTFLFAGAALKCAKNDKAIEILVNRKRSIRAYPFYYLDLMLGSAKLSRLDEDADVYINSYINYFEGRNYIKDAYRKLAWYGLVIKGDKTQYLNHMVNCMEKGEKVIEEDKAAYNEAFRNNIPNPQLLKSRILFDGGYGERSLKELSRLNIEKISIEDRVEYYYRKGRIYQLLQNDTALDAFENCIELGENLKTYYACNAALQVGIIYEQNNEMQQAKSYFQKCLSMSPEEYRNGLHQKAKAGLKRLN